LIIPQGASKLAGLEVLYGKIRDLLSRGDHPNGFINGQE
jgi:hypothetical protein